MSVGGLYCGKLALKLRYGVVIRSVYRDSSVCARLRGQTNLLAAGNNGASAADDKVRGISVGIRSKIKRKQKPYFFPQNNL